MEETRKGQIALAYLKYKLRQEGVWLTPNFPQQVASTAKAIGIPTEEAMEFAKNIVNELLAGEEPSSAKNN